MPGFDGTGPMGRGSMTGRGMGYCAVPVGDTPQPQARTPQPYPVPPKGSWYGYMPDRGFGLGRGRGFGRGGGRGRGGRRGGRRR